MTDPRQEPFDPYTRRGGVPDYASMAELRRGAGIARLPSGFWYLARYEDCRRAFTDPRTFSNEGGMRAPGVMVPREERMINEMDPPDHTRLRKLEQETLNQTNYRTLEPAIRKLAEELLDALPRGRPVDLVPALCAPVPSIVTALLVGIPPEDHPRFRAWSEEVCTGEWVTHNRTARGPGLHGGHPEFAAYIDAAVAARRRAADPPDDLLTHMVRAGSEGEQLSDTEIRIALAHLIVAGNETTANLLGNLFHRLLERAELRAELAAERERVPPAIEESLRLDAPAQLINRTCRREVEVCGVRIRPGEHVMLGIASANRDEAAFGADAAVFRTDRGSPPPQLSFGFGPHLCLGANLARLEAKVVVNAFLDRFPRAALAPGFRYETIPAFWELGLARLDAVIPA
jgi:cytochrome P450